MNVTITPYMLENYVPVPESGCWLWLGGWDKYGYGNVSKHHKVVTQAHRLFYQVHKGPIPAGLCVRHKCDTPACCNPEHLLVGTHKQNMEDKARKRQAAIDRAIAGAAGETNTLSGDTK